MKESDDAKVAFLVALNRVQGLLEPVKKDEVNPHFKSRYASLAAVNEAVMGPLSEAGFVILSGGTEIGGKPYLRTTLYHVKGYAESFDYPLIVNDDNPQHLASATTYARRYSICAMFNLSTEDDDGNAAATVKTVTREPASKPAVSAEIDTIAFVPKSVTTREGEGPRGHYVAYNIVSPEGLSYSTLNETCGQIAQHALSDKKELTIGFKKNGKFLNVIKLALSVNDSKPDQELSDVPF